MPAASDGFTRSSNFAYLASSTAMTFRVVMLMAALLDATSAYSPAGVSLMSRSRVMPARPHGCVLLLHTSALTPLHRTRLFAQRRAPLNATCGMRRLQRLRMEEKADEKAEEAAPAPMDFTPATPAPAAVEEKGFDPTQCAPPRPCTRRLGLGAWGGGGHRARRAQRHRLSTRS
eukprot:scaffold32389_cov67-Phaeocystis_antarctica.AAC.5